MVVQAYALDKNDVNTLCTDVIAKETKGMSPAFKKSENGKIVPIGYQRANCHIIFDVKMEYFRRKARLVAGGHVAEPPLAISYAGLVSRDTVRIVMEFAALNDLPVKVAYIQNARITAPVMDKIWTVPG